MPKSNFTRFIYYLLAIFLIIQFTVYAQGTARISGRVLDSSTGEYLPGANVMLVGTNHGVSTDRFGNYRLDRVPLGSYTLKVSYIGYEEFTTPVSLTNANYTLNLDVKLVLTAIQISDVVVHGLLQGQVKALNQQMNSNEIKNVLSREEMEKFPDLNTADVIQRIPGVNISRSRGEGNFVYIRGTVPRLTGVTVDGQKLATSDDEDRIADLGVINSSQLSSVEVTKALTPEMDADGIGGQINLVTRSPFDYEQPTLKLDAGGGYAFQGKKPLYRFSGAYSGFFGEDNQFGYTISSSYYQNTINQQTNEMVWDIKKDVNGNTLPFTLTDYRLFNSVTTRNHYGLSGVLEYRLDNKNSFHFRGMYNWRDDIEPRNMLRYRIDSGNFLNATTVERARLAFEFQERNEAQRLMAYAIGGVHNLDDIQINYDLSYSYGRQTKLDPCQIKSEWAFADRYNLIMDLSDVDFPKFTFTNMAPDFYKNLAKWEIDNQDYRMTDIKNNNYTGAVNVKLPYDLFGLPAELKTGVKFMMDQKDKVADRSRYQWRGTGKIYMSEVNSNTTIEDFLKNHHVFAPMIDNDRLRAFFEKYKDQSTGLRRTINYVDPDGEGGNYDNKETIISFYLMTTFNVDNLTVLAGLRNELTKTNYKGNQVFLASNGDFLSMSPVENKKDYNNLFPYLHLRYKLTPQTNLRAAVTKTIARPNFWDLAPFYWLNPKDKKITRGNSELLPTTSINLDLMFEHYFQGIGVISAGVFYKDMDKIIYSREYQQVGGQYDGYGIEEPVNGGSSKLYGIELNWMQQFSFLPGFLNGFGIYANYTNIKSKASLQYRDWTTMPGQAGDVGNIGISYEKYGLTARLSLNYSAEVLYLVGKNPDYDRYNDKQTRLDFSSVYKIFDNLAIYFDLLNITNQNEREYYGVTSRPRVNGFLGVSMRSGIKFDL